MQRWVKLYDKFTEWEWFTNSHMVHIFIYLFLRANTVTEKYRGIDIQRGQLVTSLAKIAADTHISMQSVRTCLRRLLSTGEITKLSLSQYTIITIVNYDRYQLPPTPTATTETAITASPETAQSPGTNTEEAFLADMLHDDYWNEMLCMRHKITSREVLHDYIQRFFVDAACRGKQHSNLYDAKSHFNSWLTIIKQNEQNNQRQSATQAKRRGIETATQEKKDFNSSF